MDRSQQADYWVMEPRIIYEDKNFLAIDKPAGLLVHGTANSKSRRANGERTLVNWLLARYPEIAKVGDDPKTRPGIIHRLDRDTSGILLVAKNQKYFEYLKNLFQTRAIKKTYRALVYGRVTPKKGKIEKDILIKSGGIKRTVHKGRGERVAITEYKILKYLNGFSWIEATPLTGRTHQIRIHLASIGHPIVGDKLYTPRKLNLTRLNLVRLVNRQMLHAYSLEFSPAPGKRLKLAADLPEDIKAIINAL